MAYIRIATANYSNAYAGQQLYCEYQILSQSGNTYNLRFQLVGYYPSGNTSYNNNQTNWTFNVGSHSYNGTSTFGSSTYKVFKTVDLTYTGGQSISVSGTHASGVSLGNASVSGTVTLATGTTTTYSTITGMPTNNGANDNADWTYTSTPPSSGLTRKLVMCDTSTNGAGNFFVLENVGNSQTVNLGGASSLWKKHPNEDYVVVSMRHCTMQGTTLKHIDYTDFRVNITNANPSLGTWSLKDTNSATTTKTNDNTKCIKGYSTICVTISTAPTKQKSANFARYEATCGGVTKTLPTETGTITFPKCKSNSVTLKVIDSRGKSASATKTMTLYSYTPVSISGLSASRPSTTTAKLAWTKTGTPTGYTYKYKLKSASSWTTGDQTSIASTATQATLSESFTSSSSYDMSLTVTDGVSSATATTTLSVYGVPLIITNTNKLKINQNYTLVMDNNNVSRSLLNYIHPIGSIYMTSRTDFDPAVTWGGTWEKIEGRFLIGASDDYPTNSTGGNANLTLRALIGAVNGLTDSVGYKAADPISGQTYTHAIRGTGQSSISTVNHATPVMDVDQATETTSILPPYRAVFMWRRTA